MPVQRWWHISRKKVEENPKFLFVFGDNIVQQGYGGQAAACRGEPNVVGIPTKFFPTNEDNAFFKDDDYKHVAAKWDAIFARLHQHLQRGGTVVIPHGGIGTGRARLKEKAPALWQLLQLKLALLDKAAHENLSIERAANIAV